MAIEANQPVGPAAEAGLFRWPDCYAAGMAELMRLAVNMVRSDFHSRVLRPMARATAENTDRHTVTGLGPWNECPIRLALSRHLSTSRKRDKVKSGVMLL